MFKKLTSLFLAIVICAGTAISASAEPDTKKIVEVSPIYVSSSARGFGVNDNVYADVTVASNLTAILGGYLSDGCFKLEKNDTVILKFYISDYYEKIETGYYNYNDNKYQKFKWDVCCDTVLNRYEYTCSIDIPKDGHYKFYITNNTASYVTFISPTVSF